MRPKKIMNIFARECIELHLTKNALLDGVVVSEALKAGVHIVLNGWSLEIEGPVEFPADAKRLLR